MHRDRLIEHRTTTSLVVLAVCLLFAAGSGCGSSGENGNELPPEVQSVPFTVMTYNIMFDIPNPGYDCWSVRKQYVLEAIQRQGPDLIGFQEPLPWQANDLETLCPEYHSIIDVSLDTDVVLFLKKERFQAITQGSYWLSPKPEIPWSIGFGNCWPRLVIWAKILDLEYGIEFFFVTTHFDNTSPSQDLSAPLFLERTEPLALEAPVIVTGDFNSDPESDAYTTLTTGKVPDQTGFVHDQRDEFHLVDSFFLAPAFEVVARSGDDTSYDPSTRIDHIFLAGGTFSCQHWIVDKTSYGEQRKYPSDHSPIVARVQLVVPR